MATIGGPNLNKTNLKLYLDSTNRNSYISGSSVWGSLINNNSAILENITFNNSDSTIGLPNTSSKIESTIQNINSSNFSICFTTKLKQAFNEIQLTTRQTDTYTQNPETNIKFNVFCITFSRSNDIITQKIYLNGQQVKTNTYSNMNYSLSSPINLKILTNNSIGNSNIQDLLIYDKELSSSEVLQNYNSLYLY
jgi:hypothetical protein